MSNVRRVLVPVCTLVATLAALLTLAPAAAAEPTLTVTPSTDLVDRQSVDVEGVGFLADTTFGATMCGLDAAQATMTVDGCDLSTSVLTSTDAAGTVSFAMTVKRFIQVQGEQVDCALPDECIIGAATLGNDLITPIEPAFVPIQFDPDAPVVPPIDIDLDVSDVSGDAVAGTVVCNRAGTAYVDGNILQRKHGNYAGRYGYIELPCDTVPTAFEVPLVYGEGRVTGGTAEYSVYASVSDGFEYDDDYESGSVHVTGSRPPVRDTFDQPGQNISIVDVRATSRGGQSALLVTVECSTPLMLTVDASVDQLAGLASVYGYGYTDEQVPCDGTAVVDIALDDGGILVGGPAHATVSAYSFTGNSFDYTYRTQPVNLSGRTTPDLSASEPRPGSRITIESVDRGTLTGSIECESPVMVDLGASLLQLQGRSISYGYGYDFIECDGTHAFSLPLYTDELRGGRTHVSVTAYAYTIEPGPMYDNYVFQWQDQQGTTIRLRR